MITIFSWGNLSALSSQAVSTIRGNVFRRLDPREIEYYTTMDAGIPAEGSIRRVELAAGNKYLRFIRKVRYMRRLKPDFLMVTGEPFEVFVHFLRPRGTRTILHMNGAMPPSWREYPYPFKASLYFAIAFLLRRADFVITIAEHARDSAAHFRQDMERVVSIYNGVDLDAFHPRLRDRSVLARFGLDSDRPVVLYVGMLTKRKRPELVLELARRNPRAQFLFAGAPTGDYDLAAEIRRVPNAKWVENVGRKDLGVLFASVDAFIFPSLYEGFGMVVAEAMAAGCPVLASRHQGPGELIEGGVDGILINVQSSETEISDFDQALGKILTDGVWRETITRNARRKAEERFGWDRLAHQWHDAILHAYRIARPADRRT